MTHKLSPEIADRLLDLLASDDDFRGRFQNDPYEALRSLGADVTREDVPPVTGLADKETIRTMRGSLREHMLGPLGFWPFKLG